MVNYVTLLGIIDQNPTVYEDQNQLYSRLILRLEERGLGGIVVTTHVPCEGAGQMAEQMATFTRGGLLSVAGMLHERRPPPRPEAALVVLVRYCALLS